MSINFQAVVTAGTHYMEEVDNEVAFAHTSKEVVSTLDLGCHHIMRHLQELGERTMTGAECIQWLNGINTFQGNLAKLYIEQLMTYYNTPVGYVSILLKWG